MHIFFIFLILWYIQKIFEAQKKKLHNCLLKDQQVDPDDKTIPRQGTYPEYCDFYYKGTCLYCCGGSCLYQDTRKNISRNVENVTSISTLLEGKLTTITDKNTFKSKNYIGNENKIDEDVTVIKTKFKKGNEEGTIAIIGPKRMDYERVVGMLEYMKENIER